MKIRLGMESLETRETPSDGGPSDPVSPISSPDTSPPAQTPPPAPSPTGDPIIDPSGY
jgi:hypothetical protein